MMRKRSAIVPFPSYSFNSIEHDSDNIHTYVDDDDDAGDLMIPFELALYCLGPIMVVLQGTTTCHVRLKSMGHSLLVMSLDKVRIIPPIQEQIL